MISGEFGNWAMTLEPDAEYPSVNRAEAMPWLSELTRIEGWPPNDPSPSVTTKSTGMPTQVLL
ncbi:MAG: hypothetical protein BWY83_03330 [bacterium ADurb.Bin478]|nr:MAG: hypothetical protein BWY83_03330 [bacterium ADurb.Bin478]